MNIVKMILDFLLSMSRLFFRQKKNGRQFCKKCGALVGHNGHCGCSDPTDGDSPGSSGSHHGGCPGTEKTTNTIEPGNNEKPSSSTEEITNRLIGWTLIGIALWKIIA